MYHSTATESPYCLRGAKTNWTPTLARVFYKFGYVRFSIDPRLVDPSFWKKFRLSWLGGLKKFKKWPKIWFIYCKVVHQEKSYFHEYWDFLHTTYLYHIFPNNFDKNIFCNKYLPPLTKKRWLLCVKSQYISMRDFLRLK